MSEPNRAIDLRRKAVEAFAEPLPQPPRGTFLVAVEEWAQAMEREAMARGLAMSDLGRACNAIAEVRADRAK